jgi:hypothetical protein
MGFELPKRLALIIIPVLSISAFAFPSRAQDSIGKNNKKIHELIDTAYIKATEYFRLSDTAVTSLKDRHAKAVESEDIVGYGLGLAWKLLDRNTKESDEILVNLKKTSKIPKSLDGIYYYILCEVKTRLGDPKAALAALAQIPKSDKSFSKERLDYLSFANLVAAEKSDQAFEEYRSLRKFFQNIELYPELENSFFELSNLYMKKGNKIRGKEILFDLSKQFPITRLSREAFQKYYSHFCPGPACQELWKNVDEKWEHARLVSFKLGMDGDVRNFLMNLLDIDEEHLIPEIAVEQLNLAEKTRLLDTADMLMSLREYETAYDVLDYLKNSKTFGGEFRKDRIYFTLARAMNSVQEPKDAAKFYRKVFSEFPRSPYAGNAKNRYVLSLHYDAQFKAEAQELRAPTFGNLPLEERLWRLFWAEYLGNEHKKAFKTAENVLKNRAIPTEAKARFEYWQARISEKRSRKDLAKQVFNKLSLESASTPYGILGKWRFAMLQGVKGPGKSFEALSKFDFEAYRGSDETNAILDLGEKGKFSQDLSRFELYSFLKSNLNAESESVKGIHESLSWSKLAVSAFDFKTASLLPRKWSALLRRPPLSEVSLQKELEVVNSGWDLVYPLAYDRILEGVSDRLGLHPFLILSIMRQESNFDEQVTSPVGAKGLMQLMPKTAQRIASLLGHQGFHPGLLGKPELNIAYGAWYLKRLVDYYKGNYVLAVAAYNGGPIAVDRWISQNPNLELDEFIENIPFKETKTYVGKVLLNLEMYERIYGRQKGPRHALALASKLEIPTSDEEMF